MYYRIRYKQQECRLYHIKMCRWEHGQIIEWWSC